MSWVSLLQPKGNCWSVSVSTVVADMYFMCCTETGYQEDEPTGNQGVYGWTPSSYACPSHKLGKNSFFTTCDITFFSWLILHLAQQYLINTPHLLQVLNFAKRYLQLEYLARCSTVEAVMDHLAKECYDVAGFVDRVI